MAMYGAETSKSLGVVIDHRQASQGTRGGVTLLMALICRYKPSMVATMARSCTLEAARTRDVLRDASSPPSVGQPPPWGQRSKISQRPKLGFVCVWCVWNGGSVLRIGPGEENEVVSGRGSAARLDGAGRNRPATKAAQKRSRGDE